ncbi:hypothetical protein QVB34_18070 [Clostridioides difficile]|nr:hypothetical protein [Clostridioides difficile]OFU08266.1 hypothetical protein HMPREF3083_04140 [Clostridium sp. HMSC19D07]MCP3314297.1 hypothetical protein [Clostridioides difficile]MCZ8465236.1 hypothetical protein [Clostridioides difficile]MDI2983924.1 hypothetical protein [Clostridioides difficile]
MVKNNDLRYGEKIKVLKEHGYNDSTKEYILKEFGKEHIFYESFLRAIERDDNKKSVLIKKIGKGQHQFSEGFIKTHTISELLEEEERIRKILE